MPDHLIQIKIERINYLKEKAGAARLDLQEINGQRSFSLLVGAAEATSIALYIGQVKLPVPLTHDLFKDTLDAFGIKIRYATITELNEGLLVSQLYLTGQERQITVTARTSDAIAMILRYGCALYITPELLERMTSMQTMIEQLSPTEPNSTHISETTDLTLYSTALLEHLLQQLLAKEEYEKAIWIRNELQRRGNRRPDLSDR